MADIVLLSTTYNSSDDFWDLRVGLPSIANSETYRFFNGTSYVEVRGTDLTYDGFAPASGTYFEIRLYDSPTYTAGTEIAVAYDLNSDFATIFSNGGLDAMAGDDTIDASAGGGARLVGGGGADNMIGSTGVDTFSYVAGSDIGSGEVLDGGGSIDIIRLANGGYFNFSLATISSVESLEFTSGDSNAVFNATQLGSTDILYFYGSGSTDTVTVYAEGSADLSALTFFYWTSGVDVIDLFGSSLADNLIGTSENDTIYGSSDNDSVNGGAGTDTAAYFGARSTFTIERVEGSGTTWLVTDTDGANVGDEGADTLTNIERLSFGAGAGAVSLVVSELIGALSDTDGTPEMVAENAGVGTAVGITAQASDGSSDAVIYSLSDDASGRFAIDGGTGTVTVTVAGALDFETSDSQGIVVRATSADGSFTEKTFSIGVTDVDEAPTDITISPPGFDENNTENFSMLLAAVDSDVGNTFTYVLDSGENESDNGFFSVSGDHLIFNDVANFEGQGRYIIGLRVTDSTGLSYQTIKTISVGNVNEAPYAIDFSSSSFNENQAPNAVAATLSGGDPEIVDTFTYALVAGDGDTDNANFSIDNNLLVFLSSADFETKSSYDVRLSVTDAGGLTFETTQTLTVNNISPEIINGTSAVNDLTGGSDIDKIFGFAGNDVLSGLGGNDILTGGLGRDIMSGGTGADDFDFNSVAEIGKSATRDRITDFQHLIDDIDLRDIDANGSAAGNAAFKFLAAKGAAFTGVKGQLHWLQVNTTGTAGDKTIIEGDINGDRIADFQIELTGLKALTAADFIL